MSTAEDQIAAEMTPDDDEQLEEAESAEAEAAPDELAPEPTDEAPPPRSQKEIDAVQDKLKAEAARHEKAVAKIMGEDFGFLVPNPTDWTPGYIFNVPAMHPMPEQVAALHELLGDAQGGEYLPAEDAEACPKCNALGEVLTGSRKQGQITKLCVGCNGTGWVTKSIPYTPPTLVQNGNTANPAAPLVPNQPIAADRWGRPYGHRDYGVDPSLVNA